MSSKVPWPVLRNFYLTATLGFMVVAFVIILTLPRVYSHFNPREVTAKDFPPSSRAKNSNKSGYDYYLKHKGIDGRLPVDASVQIVVLGDIGRSPRMQYHALSIAQHGGKVDFVGYVGSDIHPDILQSCLINIVPIIPFPAWLQTNNKLLFLLLAPCKVLWQVLSLFYASAYRCKASKWMLVQNPPSIPTLFVAQICCLLRNSRLVIDWHNFGYSILALRLGPSHPVVKISEWYEGFFARGAYAHLAVTEAMVRVLKVKWNLHAVPLHDRPAEIFQPLTSADRTEFLHRLPGTAPYAADIEAGRCCLLVSSTSWTADEDFSILLDALVQYSSASAERETLPNLVAIITGRGPLREHYLDKIQQLTLAKKLQHVIITTAWLSPEDYARLLGAADLGVSLHISSSGVDLPMKVVDMFGTGLPVVGWSKYEAWPELVQEGQNGCGFSSANELSDILLQLLSRDSDKLVHLRQGALKECGRRWNDEWMPIAGRLFRLQG